MDIADFLKGLIGGVGCVFAALIILSFLLTDKPSGNVINAETNNTVGIESLVEISFSAQLYYDQNTRIVYLWNGNSEWHQRSATMPSPYYAPNGLPYKYNPETKALEEIEPEEK